MMEKKLKILEFDLVWGSGSLFFRDFFGDNSNLCIATPPQKSLVYQKTLLSVRPGETFN